MTRLPRDIRKTVATNQLQIDPKFKRSLKNSLFTPQEGITMANKPLSFNVFSILKPSRLAPAGAIVAALVIVGGAAAFAGAHNAKQASLSQVEIPQNLTSVIGTDQVRAAALKAVPNAQIVSIELSQEDGKLVYKVRFSDGSIRLFDAQTGLALTNAPATTNKADESVPTSFVAGISIQQARDTAQAQRPGQTITKIDLETENGVVVYSVRFADGGRVDINATTGDVLSVRNGESEAKKTETESEEPEGTPETNSDKTNPDSTNPTTTTETRDR